MKKFKLVSFAAALFSMVSGLQAGPATYGDLILAFRASGGTGADINLEINLGPANHFRTAAADATEVLTPLIVADLVAIYGDDWNTRTDLSWGIAGTTGAGAVSGIPARTLWASKGETTAGTASTPWSRGSILNHQNPANVISTMYTGSPGSMDLATATSVNGSAYRVNAGEAGSWTVQEDLTPTVSFKYFNPSVVQSVGPMPGGASALDGTAYNVLDLWEMLPSSAPPTGTQGTLIGGFGLNSAGKLVFSKDVTKFGSGTTPPVTLGVPVISREAGGNIIVSLDSAPAGNYILERSPSMAEGTWTSYLTQSLSSGTLTFTDSAPLASRSFYRIKKAP